jgi:G:T-mismatch repair DNA endonuclease (very short patch repair protein)
MPCSNREMYSDYKKRNSKCYECKFPLKKNYDSTKELWFKNCPLCNNLQYYKTYSNMQGACKNQTKCDKCTYKILGFFDYSKYFDDKLNCYIKNCPKCNDIIKFKTQDGLKGSVKNNSLCHYCYTTNNRKNLEYDIFYNIATNKWERQCSQCNIIMQYESKKDLKRSMDGEFNCKKCEIALRTIDRTTYKEYDSILNLWKRECPRCNANIYYAKWNSCKYAISKNYNCKSCVSKNFTNNPEFRKNACKRMIKLLSSSHSKIEYSCFEEIKYLNFKHNIDNISISGYFPDYIHNEYNIIVEFNGDLFHANPNIEKYKDDNSIVKIGSRIKTAKEIRDRDEKRRAILESEGYIIFIIWEDDWYKNKKKDH